MTRVVLVLRISDEKFPDDDSLKGNDGAVLLASNAILTWQV